MSAWRAETESLSLVTDGGELPRLIGEAAAWSERFTLCVSAPQSERGTLAWWRELFARSSKCEGVYVRQAQRSEGWLLHRLHALGSLRLVEAGGKQVASNLWMFSRGDEMRVVLTHIPLERAAAGAAFGALLSFQGRNSAEISRACRAQLESWADLARVPTGSEIDALTLDSRRRGPLPSVDVPRGPRVVTDPAELSTELERLAAAAPSGMGGSHSSSPFSSALASMLPGAGVSSLPPSGGAPFGSGFGAAPFSGGSFGALLSSYPPPPSYSMHGSDGELSVRAFAGGYRVALGDSRFALTLHTGLAWGAGNALMLDDNSGGLLLVWRGGLLGPSRSRAQLLWSEARLATFRVRDPAIGLDQRVAVVARSGAPLEPQIAAFTRELGRLSDVFGVEPPPALGHVLSDFSTLSARQQTQLISRTLVGTGPLGFGAAASAAAEALRDQGYLRGQTITPGSVVHRMISELIGRAADENNGFDRPTRDTIRAIQAEPSAYVIDDWLECLVRALPENTVVDQRLARRLAFERARELWGLSSERLERNGSVERALDMAVSTALWRGLVVRVGSSGIKRLGRESPYPELPPAVANACPHGFVQGFGQLLDRLEPVPRFLLTRRAGWYGRSEPLEGVAQRLGLTTERARQIEADTWQKLASSSGWARELRSRLERAFAGGRSIRASELELDDAWWHGVGQHLELADAVFEGLLGGLLHRVELGSPSETFFSRFSPAEVEGALSELITQATLVPTPASIDTYHRLIDAASAPLDACLGEGMLEAIEARLELDPEDPTHVLALGTGTGAVEPFPVEPKSTDSEALLRLEDALRSLFRAAGTPLSLDAVIDRLQKRLDVDRAQLEQRLVSAPFVRRNPDQYGLIARDVPGGHEAIASVLNDIAEALRSGQRALGPDPVWALVQARVQQAWSPELVRSLIAGDTALALSPSNDTSLRRWEHARLLPHGPVICPGVPAAARPRFDKLAQQPSHPSAVIAERLASEMARLESAGDGDDLGTLPLARQLGDLSGRLLEQTAEPASEALARAAVEFFLEALAPNEDDLDAPPIDRARLAEARAVLAAVLRWLGLSWLDEAPRPLARIPAE